MQFYIHEVFNLIKRQSTGVSSLHEYQHVACFCSGTLVLWIAFPLRNLRVFCWLHRLLVLKKILYELILPPQINDFKKSPLITILETIIPLHVEKSSKNNDRYCSEQTWQTMIVTAVFKVTNVNISIILQGKIYTIQSWLLKWDQINENTRNS